MLWLQTLGFSVRTCKTLSPPKGKQRCGNSPQRINRIIAGHIVKRFFVLDGINASPCIRDDCVNWSTAYSVTLNIASGPQRTMTRQGCVPIHQVTSEEWHSGQHLQVLSLSSQERCRMTSSTAAEPGWSILFVPVTFCSRLRQSFPERGHTPTYNAKTCL